MECSVGLSQARDLVEATREAARQARQGLTGGPPQAALIVTAGDPLPMAGNIAREVLGPIPIAGGGSAGLISDAGILRHGVAVVCFRSDDWVIQSACAGPAALAPSLAADRAARLILAGRPNRRRYPRGVALAFADFRATDGAGSLAGRWRQIMGPRLKGVGSVIPEGQGLYCGAVPEPGPLSVLCLEGPGPVGIEWTSMRLGGEPPMGAEVHLMAAGGNGLQQAARDAAVTAVKRLEGQPPRGLLAVESAARWAVQEDTALREWEAVREQVPPETPCLGWLTAAELVFGGGGQFALQQESVAIIALP